ncbi:MAG: hypothetical protein JWN78_3327 [Bacteroidota bacterium]|nr:hypothetical protein [Bacteroidota bacterium]
MKRNILQTVAIILMVICYGKANAQSDLLASLYSSVPNNISTRFTEENVKVSDLILDPTSAIASAMVNVNSINPITMKIRIFMNNGNLVKEESFSLNSGSNELNVEMNDLAKGVYIVQLYSNEGSAVRKIIKMD